MQDEDPAHPERSTEKPGLEDDIVSRRSLPRFARRGCGVSVGRPVVLGEYESGEIDFAGQLEKSIQRGGPGIELCRPGMDVRAVFQAARQRVQQLLLRFR
jgi:hypothetical protein